MLTFTFENIRMQENQNFPSFYYELSDIVNSSFNLGEPIPYFKVVKKSLLERFLPKVIAIEENKEIDLMIIDELVGSIKIYVMTIPNSQRPKESTFKAFEKKDKKRLKCYITRDELAHMAKQLKGPWNWPENLEKINNLENEKELIIFLKKIIKVSPKVKKK